MPLFGSSRPESAWSCFSAGLCGTAEAGLTAGDGGGAKRAAAAGVFSATEATGFERGEGVGARFVVSWLVRDEPLRVPMDGAVLGRLEEPTFLVEL